MKYLPVVIVDDDHLVLHDLKNIVNWESLGFTISGTAQSGEDALKLIHKYNPVLLITDIRMYAMDGLDLIELVRKDYPDMRFLIISAYNEFNYARRAIANGVIDYILKTEITAQSLTQKLLEISQHFHSENVNNLATIDHELSTFFSAYPNTSINNEFFPHLTPLKKTPYYFYIVAPSQIFTLNSNPAQKEPSLELDSVKSAAYEFAQKYCSKPLICSIDGHIILALTKDFAIGHPLNILKEFGERLPLQLPSSSLPYLRLYNAKTMFLSDFASCYKQINPIIHYFQLFYPDKPLPLETLLVQHYIPVSYTFPFHSIVFDATHNDENLMLIKDYVTRCCQNYDIYSLQSFYRNFCSYLGIKSNNQFSFPATLHAPDPAILLKWLFNTLNDCINLLTRGLNYKYRPAVDSAIEFIHQNYSNPDLSSSDIAEHVHLSVNRLGVLFKQDTGKTINEYLNAIRVEKAVHLLEKTNMKIYEIGLECGYKSSQYFSQVVYMKTGKRPIDYRKTKKS